MRRTRRGRGLQRSAGVCRVRRWAGKAVQGSWRREVGLAPQARVAWCCWWVRGVLRGVTRYLLAAHAMNQECIKGGISTFLLFSMRTWMRFIKPRTLSPAWASRAALPRPALLWGCGVTAQGDARAAFPPDLAQGVNSALEDVATLADVGGHDLRGLMGLLGELWGALGLLGIPERPATSGAPCSHQVSPQLSGCCPGLGAVASALVGLDTGP